MPSGRLYTVHTVMQIIGFMPPGFRALAGPYKLMMLNSDAVRRLEGR
jgi:hypothetical protein